MKENLLEIIATIAQFVTSVIRIAPPRFKTLLDKEVRFEYWMVAIACMSTATLAIYELGVTLDIPKPSALIPLYLWTFIHIINVYDVYRNEKKQAQGKRQVPVFVFLFLAIGYVILDNTRHDTDGVSAGSIHVSDDGIQNPGRREFREEFTNAVDDTNHA